MNWEEETNLWRIPDNNLATLPCLRGGAQLLTSYIWATCELLPSSFQEVQHGQRERSGDAVGKVTSTIPGTCSRSHQQPQIMFILCTLNMTQGKWHFTFSPNPIIAIWWGNHQTKFNRSESYNIPCQYSSHCQGQEQGKYEKLQAQMSLMNLEN